MTDVLTQAGTHRGKACEDGGGDCSDVTVSRENQGLGFPGGPVVKPPCFQCMGLISGWGTKISYVGWHGKKKKCQGFPVTPETSKRQEKILTPSYHPHLCEPAEGAGPCPHLDFGLLTSGIVTVNLCGFKPPICGHLLRQPWEMDAG